MRRPRSIMLILATVLASLIGGLLPTSAAAAPNAATEPTPATVAGEAQEPGAPRCYVSPKAGVRAVNVRPTAGTDQPPIGRISAGQRAPASCRAIAGGHYRACGGASQWWVPVRWQGQRGYVAQRCIDWYKPIIRY